MEVRRTVCPTGVRREPSATTVAVRRVATAYIVATGGILVAAGSVSAQTAAGRSGDTHVSARHSFRVVTVAEDLDHPWSMAWLPSGEMLITERPGRLRIIRDGVLDPEPISGWPPVYKERGQGGFMDIVPHPDFATNRLLYLSYGKPNEDASMGTTTVVRGRLEGNRVVDVEEVFESDAWYDNNNHFSGRMAFGHDGYLFLTVGDRMLDPDLLADHPAQDVTNHMGTIVRLHDDGRVPGDNPFVGRDDALPEIWSYGHRNLQGLAVHPETGDLWSNEHGPRGGDELNRIVPGRNYGWPITSHGIHYDGRIITMDEEREGIESPRYVWVPSIGISGLMFYTGDQFPWWRGNAFVGGMVGAQLGRVALSGATATSEETLLGGALGRIRDVREGPDGFVYLAIEAEQGGTPLSDVVRLEPTQTDVTPPR